MKPLTRQELAQLEVEWSDSQRRAGLHTVPKGRWLDLAMEALGLAKHYRLYGQPELTRQCLTAAALYREAYRRAR